MIMYSLRLGSNFSTLTYSDNMPPCKRQKTSADTSSDKVLEASPSKDSVDSEWDPPDFGAEWREKCTSLSSRNLYALKHNVLSDVTLLVGSESTAFPCHRLILALGSPVFEAMFYGSLPETGDTVTIPDVDAEGFGHLVKFLYSDELSFKTDVAAFKTYFAADKYCITKLKKRCENYLGHCKLNPSNVWLFLESSLFLNSQYIKNRCLAMLMRSIRSALNNSGYLDVNQSTMETVLDMDSLNISEQELLASSIFWALQKSKLEKAAPFEEILRPLLKLIRFGGLNAQEFVSMRRTTKLSEVITEQDALAILEHIINPKECRLPKWCCSKEKRNYNAKAAESAEVRYGLRKASEAWAKIFTVDYDVDITTSESSNVSSDSSSDSDVSD